VVATVAMVATAMVRDRAVCKTFLREMRGLANSAVVVVVVVEGVWGVVKAEADWHTLETARIVVTNFIMIGEGFCYDTLLMVDRFLCD